MFSAYFSLVRIKYTPCSSLYVVRSYYVMSAMFKLCFFFRLNVNCDLRNVSRIELDKKNPVNGYDAYMRPNLVQVSTSLHVRHLFRARKFPSFPSFSVLWANGLNGKREFEKHSDTKKTPEHQCISSEYGYSSGLFFSIVRTTHLA